jgi:hypothetical protein
MFAMKTFFYLMAVALILLPQGARAQLYKCIEKDKAMLVSDRPCPSGKEQQVTPRAERRDNPATNAPVNPLASETESPKPLSRALVDDLFGRFERACDAQDGEMLLDQFSGRMRKYFMRSKPASMFDRLSYLCSSMANIKKETEGSSFGSTFKKGASMTVGSEGVSRRTAKTELCVYSPKETNKCAGGPDIVFEDGKLKIDEH